MGEWANVTLGEVMGLEVNTVDVDPQETYDIVGVLNRGRGLLYREPMHGSDTKYSTLNQIRAGQVVYSRLKAFEGAITVAPERSGPVYASQEFPTFTCSPDLLPRYFQLLTTTKPLWDQLQNLSTGMGGRRERVKPQDFLTIPIALPPVVEQCRILDVISAVDAQIEVLAEEAERVNRAAIVLRDDLLADLEAPSRALGDLTTKIGSGATPRGGEAAYVDDGVALIRSQNVYDGWFEWAGLARITDEQARLLNGVTVERGDVLINITGASVNRVTVVPDPVLPARVNQHVAILRCDTEAITPAYLAQILRRSDLKRDLDVMATSGSTRQALTKDGLRAFKIPVPPLPEQGRLVRSLDSAVQSIGTVRDELEHLRGFRGVLLTSLLNQEIEIPASYDRLLEVAG